MIHWMSMCDVVYIPGHSLIPFEKDLSEDGKDYIEWAKQGYVDICPGNENDYSLVVKWFFSLFKDYGIRIYKIGYDNWQAKDLIKGLNEMGCETERIRMGFDGLSSPMKLVEADLKSKLHVYNSNPVDEWCFGNTGIKVDNFGRIMPEKMEIDKRIDGAVTSIITYAVYGMYRSEFLRIVAA